MAMRAILRLAIVGMISVVALVGCSTKTSCNPNPYTGGVTCSESQSGPDLSNLPWGAIGIGLLCGLVALFRSGDAVGAKGPRPKRIQTGDLRPGDRVVSVSGQVVVVKEVTWVNDLQVRLTYTNGATHAVDGSMVVTKLPQ
jgi:hypothetical protein